MKKIKKEELEIANQIIAVGSVDGVLTTAALLRVIGNSDIPIIFCQAFTVDKFDVTNLASNRNIIFVDLGVNNIATTSTGLRIEGKARQDFKQKRAKVRASLQSKGKQSTKKVLRITGVVGEWSSGK